MKKIFKYFGIFLSVALLGAFTGCIQEQEIDSAEIGLGIKVFFPTKVVTGQPVTINGTGFQDVTEVVFPGDIAVTSFERVGGNMIRVVTPYGLPAEGGTLKVRTPEEEAVAGTAMTIGNTVVTGFSKQEGETVTGGEQIMIYGKDLEFINGVELLDPDGIPYVIHDDDFYRKGTNSVVITVPKRNIFTGSFAGKLFTIDGKEFKMPELAYEPSMEGGHWATVKKTLWKGDGSAGAVSWSGQYRFALEGHETGEEIHAFPEDEWKLIKTETIFLVVEATDPQIRVTTGWWSGSWCDKDFQPGNDERLADNGDGTWTLTVTLSDPDYTELLDDQHLLFTGDRFTPLELYYEAQEWVEGEEEEGHWEIVKDSFWKGDGSAGAVSWSGQYRFALEGHETGEEIASFPVELWERIKSETFYLVVEATDPQIRVTTGWWSGSWCDKDFQPGNDERLVDNGDGTWTLEINLSDPDYTELLDEQHLLFTGDRFTPIELYFEKEEWVSGGGGHLEIVKTSVWKGDGSAGAVSWSGQYRFALEGHETGEEIASIPADIWEKLKTETFYIDVEATDPQVRVTTGWWSANMTADDIQPGNELITDNGDGTWTVEINLSSAPDLVAAMDEQHLLFTGDRFTLLEIYFQEEVMVGGGGGGSKPKEVVVWEGDGSAGAVSWSGQYRFALEGHETGEEIAAIPADTWDKLKSQTFYIIVEGEDPQVRVTTGWWSTNMTADDIQPGNELITDNGDGTWTVEVNLAAAPDLVAAMDEQHLLFTGDRYSLKKIYFLE